MPRGSKPALSPEQDQQVEAAYAAGKSAAVIAAEMGTTERIVLSSLARSGVTRRTLTEYGWQDTPENRAEIVRLFHEGFSVPRIAKTVRTRNDKVSGVLREEGVQARFGGGNPRFTDEDARQIAEKQIAGMSVSAIAREYGTNVGTVRSTLRRIGVEVIVRPTPRGKANHNWKGGRQITGEGYVRLLVLDEDRYFAGSAAEYVLEHRLVMARALGRPLTKTESVHHINGVHDDNRLENLQLRQGAHGKGVRMVCIDCGSHNVVAKALA